VAPAAVRLTGDELTALARGLGAPFFPGVTRSLYDDLDPDVHARLDGGFLATLMARGLLEPDGDHLWPAEPLGALMAAFASHRTYVVIEQTGSAVEPSVRALAAGDDGTVHHRIGEPVHVLELDAAPLGTALADLVGRSPGAGRPGRHRYRGQRSTIVDVVPVAAGGWRRTTAMVRSDMGRHVRVDGFLAVLDGGPGELWLVTDDEADARTDIDTDAGPDTADPSVVARPADADDVDAALAAFAA
jgi:hypothetical protein